MRDSGYVVASLEAALRIIDRYYPESFNYSRLGETGDQPSLSGAHIGFDALVLEPLMRIGLFLSLFGSAVCPVGHIEPVLRR